jgi:hypothetical protein
MAQATNVSTISPSRFYNLADPALADALGHADALLKGAEPKEGPYPEQSSADFRRFHSNQHPGLF